MFGPPGHLYVYFTYGMHWCANVVTGPRRRRPSRCCCGPGEVVDGLDAGPRAPPGRRATATWPAARPGCATALGIDRAHNGVDLTRGAVRLSSRSSSADAVSTGPRVGLRGAADRPWRFWLTGDPTVSDLPSGEPPTSQAPTPA